MAFQRQLFLTFCLLLFTIGGCKKGEDLDFETSEFVDIRDGQIYRTVKIGQQWWMAENLNVYIPSGSWYYNNDSATHSETYGRLYSWDALMNGEASSYLNPSGVVGISPAGWHIPSDAEWTELENYLMTHGLSGDDLRETGISHWKPFNAGTNRTKFTALPAGTGWNDGNNFAHKHGFGAFLSSTIDTVTGGIWGRVLYYDTCLVYRTPLGPVDAWSVRCVKN